MNRFLIFMSIAAIAGFTQCTHNEETWNVVYEVNKLDTNDAALRVMYTIAGGRDVTKAPIEGDIWRSDTVFDMKEGRTARLKVTRINGNSPYRLRIYRNGVSLRTTDTDTLGSEYAIDAEI